MKCTNEKCTEEEDHSFCVYYHAPVDGVSLLNRGLWNNKLFLNFVRGSKHLRQMAVQNLLSTQVSRELLVLHSR